MIYIWNGHIPVRLIYNQEEGIFILLLHLKNDYRYIMEQSCYRIIWTNSAGLIWNYDVGYIYMMIGLC